MRTTIFRSSWLTIALAGALVAPAQLSAQRTDSTRTHVVKSGETLWSLAATYLGDSQRWREILALNPGVRAADALVVGSSLKIPSARTAPSTVRDTNRAIANDPAPAEVRTQSRSPRRTIFFGNQPAGGFTTPDTTRRAPVDSGVPARVYESMSAPFVIDQSLLDRSGRCLSVGSGGTSPEGGVLLHGGLSLDLPNGSLPDTGARFLLVRRGPVLAGLGAVVIPTGVVRLTSGNTVRGAAAEVLAQYDAMSCSDLVVPAASAPLARGGRLTTVSDGAAGTVAWVPSGSLLPTLQHALILDIGTDAGVKPGDRVTVYGGDGSAVVGSADIVRVSARSATALVVRQSLGLLAAGLRVRVTEKLP